MEVEAVTGVWLDVSLESRRGREGSLDTSRDVNSSGVLGPAVAVAATEGNVVLTSDDKGGSSEWRHLGCVAYGQDLTSGDRLLGLLTLNSKANIELVGEEEGVLKRGESRVREVSRGVVVLEDSVVVTIDQVVDLGGSDVVPDFISVNINTNFVKNRGEAGNNIALNTVLPGKRLDASSRSVAEAEGLIQTRAVEIPPSDDIRKELSGSRVASKDNTIGVIGIQGGEPERLDRAEGVTNVNNFLVGAANLGEGTSA